MNAVYEIFHCRIRYMRGGTNTYLALSNMTSWFQSTVYGSRPKSSGIPKVAVVLTDGISANKLLTIRYAKQAHDQDITVFAIGVGSSKFIEQLKKR